MNDMYEDLKVHLREKFKVQTDQIGADTLLADLGLDSLAQLDLLFHLEEKYGVEVDFSAGELKTVGDVLQLFEAAAVTH